MDVKSAVHTATTFVGDLFPEARDLRLEEVVPSSNGWSVVVSFKPNDSPTLAEVMGSGTRLFKEILVDSESAKPLSLKIWKL